VTPSNRLDPAIVQDVLLTRQPVTVQQLADDVIRETGASKHAVVVMLKSMVCSGELRVKSHSKCDWIPPLLRRFLEAHPFLKSLLQQYKTEALFKALSLLLVLNAISWIIILAFQSNAPLAAFRIIFHGINLLFLPGFAFTISWYPFPSKNWDFNTLVRTTKESDGRKGEDQNHQRVLDPITRVAYSICYSIGLVVLVGFLIGLLGLGFNITIMLGLFTTIEWLVIVDVIIKIHKLLDPYLHI
jgi:hypothetical protein